MNTTGLGLGFGVRSIVTKLGLRLGLAFWTSTILSNKTPDAEPFWNGKISVMLGVGFSIRIKLEFLSTHDINVETDEKQAIPLVLPEGNLLIPDSIFIFLDPPLSIHRSDQRCVFFCELLLPVHVLLFRVMYSPRTTQ